MNRFFTNIALSVSTMLFVAIVPVFVISMTLGLYDMLYRGTYSPDNLFALTIAGPIIAIFFGTFYSVPLGLLAVVIFTQLMRLKRHSYLTFGLTGMICGSLFIFPMIQDLDAYSSVHGFAVIGIFLTGGFLTGCALLPGWKAFYVAKSEIIPK